MTELSDSVLCPWVWPDESGEHTFSNEHICGRVQCHVGRCECGCGAMYVPADEASTR